MKMLSLFSGIGGIDLAADWAGIETVAMCEIEPFCQKVLNKHWPEVVKYSDVRTVTKKQLEKDKIEKIDILAGGFPCQPFSSVGQRRGQEDEKYLWNEMLRIVGEVKPKWVLGENVAGLLSIADISGTPGGTFGTIISDLAQVGYRVGWSCYGANEIGAQHKRDRVFIIAYADGFDGQTLESKERMDRKINKEKAYEWEHVFFVNRGNYQIEVRPEDQHIFCREDDGISEELDGDRLKALGNAVHPYQIYPIFKAIMDIENS